MGIPGESAATSNARFELRLMPGEPVSEARILVRQNQGQLRELVLDAARLQTITGNGKITRDQGRVRWIPPTGGQLQYRVSLNHLRPSRKGQAYDAWVGPEWAIFRGEDAFPLRSLRRTKGSVLAGELVLELPRQWSLITPYLPDPEGASLSATRASGGPGLWAGSPPATWARGGTRWRGLKFP